MLYHVLGLKIIIYLFNYFYSFYLSLLFLLDMSRVDMIYLALNNQGQFYILKSQLCILKLK